MTNRLKVRSWMFDLRPTAYACAQGQTPMLLPLTWTKTTRSPLCLHQPQTTMEKIIHLSPEVWLFSWVSNHYYGDSWGFPDIHAGQYSNIKQYEDVAESFTQPTFPAQPALVAGSSQQSQPWPSAFSAPHGSSESQNTFGYISTGHVLHNTVANSYPQEPSVVSNQVLFRKYRIYIVMNS